MTRRILAFPAVVGVLLGLSTLGPLPAPAAAAVPAELPAPSAPPAHNALTLAQQRLDQARAEATDLSAKISAAQSEQARLEADIADAERRIPELRARAVALRNQVKERAADLYVRHGGSTALESALDAESAEDGLRAAHLTDTIGNHDLQVAVEARNTAAQLAVREGDLRSQRADLDRTLASLAPLNLLLQKKLADAAGTFDKVQALQAAGAGQHGTDVATLASACPVQGFAVFTDDFGELRTGGPHPGIDMGAVTGTPVVAVVAGFMRHDVGGDGGNSAWLLGSDQVAYYYAHFSRYEGDDRFVAAGDVIGYVGQTGNATGPHLHFEVHPGSGPPVDPYATLLSLCSDDPPTRGN